MIWHCQKLQFPKKKFSSHFFPLDFLPHLQTLWLGGGSLLIDWSVGAGFNGILGSRRSLSSACVRTYKAITFLWYFLSSRGCAQLRMTFLDLFANSPVVGCNSLFSHQAISMRWSIREFVLILSYKELPPFLLLSISPFSHLFASFPSICGRIAINFSFFFYFSFSLSDFERCWIWGRKIKLNLLLEIRSG